MAIKVKVRAQAFRKDEFIASMIASLEKNPARNGAPERARLPMRRQDVVIGRAILSPPIFRISCSLFKLWIIEPEHKKSIALKKACVQMCRKARRGWFSPIVTIIRPSWLDVENATIFLMSFCVKAHVAVNTVVIAPRRRQSVRAVSLFWSSG